MIVKKARLDLRNFLFDDKIEEGIVYILDRPAWINRASAFPSRSNFLFQRHAEVNNKKFIFVDFDDDSFQNLGEELYCFSISKKRNELKNWRDFEENDYLTDDKIGLDGIFPSSIKRYFFYYRNGRLYNITDKVFPNTEITFNVKTDNINELALVGDFNSWNPKSHRLTKIGNNIWQVSLSLSPGKYAYKFLVDGKNWVNNPNSDFYCDIPSFGISSCLGVVNYSLPFGLLSQADNTYVEKVIKLRKELIFYPESAILHEQIAELYLEKNYNFESLAEFNVARELERAGKL